MSSTLHAATVGIYSQILPQVARLIDKAEAHCAEHGLAAEALTDARLAPDMWNFAMQVQCSVQHSAGAVQALRSGKTGPDLRTAPTDFASLREMVAAGLGVLQTVEPGEIDAAADRDILFEYGTGRMEFAGEDYLLSFALPNFMFHSATAYAVLRSQGVAIGKRDFLGRTRARV
jgi:uncharacterized protein